MSGIPPAAKIAYAETHELFFHNAPRSARYSVSFSAESGADIFSAGDGEAEDALPILSSTALIKRNESSAPNSFAI